MYTITIKSTGPRNLYPIVHEFCNDSGLSIEIAKKQLKTGALLAFVEQDIAENYAAKYRTLGCTVSVDASEPHAETDSTTQEVATAGYIKKWFYDVNGTKIGPVSVEELQKAHKDGLITEETYVWTISEGEWRPLFHFDINNDMKELILLSEDRVCKNCRQSCPSANYICPHCGCADFQYKKYMEYQRGVHFPETSSSDQNNLSSNRHLIICPHCDEKIPATIVKCPYCAEDVRMIEVSEETSLQQIQKAAPILTESLPQKSEIKVDAVSSAVSSERSPKEVTDNIASQAADLKNKIQKLQKLLDEGIIADNEFKNRKNQLINQFLGDDATS